MKFNKRILKKLQIQLIIYIEQYDKKDIHISFKFNTDKN